MRVAVILTGGYRTLPSTLPYYHEIFSDEYDFFAVVHQNEVYPYLPPIVDKVDAKDLLEAHLGWKLKSFTNYSLTPEYEAIRKRQLSKMNITNYWRHYLLYSGTMIEYHQFQIAFEQMKAFEVETGVHYSRIVRFRVDTLVNCRLQVHAQVPLLGSTVCDFSSCFFPGRNFQGIEQEVSPSNLKIAPDLLDRDWVVALRNNVIYVCTRNAASKIALLGEHFGDFLPPDTMDADCNAEMQLKSVCEYHKIPYLTSTTHLEHMSLIQSQYNPARYFDDSGKIRKGEFTFFIKRT